MTSFTSPVSLYNLCSGNVWQTSEYSPGSCMHYIYRKSPLFAFILQEAALDLLLDDPSFNGTVFVPNYEYSSAHIRYFMDYLDRKTARNIADGSIIRGRITRLDLLNMEVIPTRGKIQSIAVNVAENKILLNEVYEIIKNDVMCENGIVHVINGLIQPRCLE